MKLFKFIPLTILIFLLSMFFSCENKNSPTESSLPEVDEVIIVGTQVDDGFLSNGQFGLTAIPLDNQGTAILSNQVSASVTINQPANLTSTVSINQVVTPSGNPLAVALDIDGSGSMGWNDTQRLRVSGAQFFVDVLDVSGYPFEVAIMEFGGPTNHGFYYTGLHQDFTNDVDSLKNAIDLIGASGGTPTYESLIEVLNYVDTTKSAAEYERAIVLLSDGEPNSLTYRDSTCVLANNLSIPIYTIGLGPASDLDSLTMSVTAVENMRYIANCTGGAYAGISPSDSTSANSIYGSMANATSQGTIIFNVTVGGSGFSGLSSGDLISGIITIVSGGTNAVASFSFVIP